MVEWLAIWGISAVSVFRPILEDIAKDVTKDAAKSYVGKCFKNVFSVIYKEPLTKATGQALKELLQLIEDELIRADIEEERLKGWVPDVKQFVHQASVRDSIAALFLQSDYYLDPKIFMAAWQQLDYPLPIPEGFSWPYVAKRFAAKVVAIRESSTELQDTFASLAQAQNSQALQELAGLPPEFNLETYREALVERYGTVDLASLDTTGAYYEVRLWSVFVAQSVRECHEYDPQLLEIPKDQLRRLVEAGELDAAQLAESEKLHDERRQSYINQPTKPVQEVTDDGGIARQVILGDPGSGKSSLLRYLALQWARINDANKRYTQPLPLLIELREYHRWQCPSHKGFLKYLHEASNWHRLNQQTLKHLLEQPSRVVLLLDGLDEVF
ncbi:MAG: NACHT domain-containing protein [Cyanobacteria bacterium P01_F01_bin.53]